MAGEKQGKQLPIQKDDPTTAVEKMKPFREAGVTARVPPRTIDYYRSFLERHYEGVHFKDKEKTLRDQVSRFEEFLTVRLEEYERKGYIGYD